MIELGIMILTKIVITNCHENLRKFCFIFEILRLHYLNLQLPPAYGLNENLVHNRNMISTEIFKTNIIFRETEKL